MAKMKKSPEPTEESGGGSKGKQKVNAEESEKVEESQMGAEVSKDARIWAMICHLLGFFTSFVGPLIVWLLKKEEDPFIDDQGKEAVNFQITVAIAWIVSLAVSVMLTFLICIAPLLAAVVGITDLVFCIRATVKANDGEKYRYPVSIRFIK